MALRYAPNGQQRDVEASKTFANLGKCGANGRFVLVFSVADGPVPGVSGKIDLLVRAEVTLYDPG